jgi:hypothetical protein
MLCVNTVRAWIAALFAAGIATMPAHAQWSVVFLHPPAVDGSEGYGIGGGHQVGVTGRAGVFHAALWTGSAGSWVDLHPGGIFDLSEALAAGGGQQAGDVHVAGSQIHASLWSGTAASWVDLSPAGSTESEAFGVHAGQQAGYASFPPIGGVGTETHAGIWTGTAASWVDLNPIGSTVSEAFATDGVRQVGYAVVGGSSHASLWSGSAASWVDLNPFGTSQALGVQGGQQVGRVDLGGDHASLWTGSAGSWVDLNPIDSERSVAYAVDAGEQVGYSRIAGQDHAGLWSGSADSFVDFYGSLSADYDNFYAKGIWHDAGVTYVVGTAHNWVLGRDEAVMWVRAGCSTPVLNDECTGALPAVLGLNAFDNTCATTSAPPTTCGPMGRDLWYTYAPPFTGVLEVTTCGLAAADTALAIYSDCNTSIACNDDACGSRQSDVSACVEAFHTYFLRIGGFNGAICVGDFNLIMSAQLCVPGRCCRADFNGDGDIGTDQDIMDFFDCLGGHCCATCPPNADFNCDGDIGTDLDIQSFFSVLGGGPC